MVAPSVTAGIPSPVSRLPRRHLHRLHDTVRVAVLGDTRLDVDAAVTVLAARPDVTTVPEEQQAGADVLLLLTASVGEEGLHQVRRVLDDAGRHIPLVVITDELREWHLWKAVSLGLVTVLPRSSITWERVAAAAAAAAAGRSCLPPSAVDVLLGQVRELQATVLGPAGLTLAGLTAREVEVLRLLAEGQDTVEIAQNLSYSVRTIKNVIHGVISRLNLRNRSHAVAYALRAGVL